MIKQIDRQIKRYTDRKWINIYINRRIDKCMHI